MMSDRTDFAEDAFVKIVSVAGTFHYGYIKESKERGLHLLICLHEEGDSAVEYELASGELAQDWDKHLSETEKTIIPLLAESIPTKEIAAQLSLSPSTIRTHIRTLRLKLQLENRQQLVGFSQGLATRLE